MDLTWFNFNLNLFFGDFKFVINKVKVLETNDMPRALRRVYCRYRDIELSTVLFIWLYKAKQI